MSDTFGTLSHVRLKSATPYIHPPELPARVYMDNPAIDVMTDFHYVTPRTIRPDVTIDDALEHMKKSGVRLLLVEDEERNVIGIITSNDIQGEKPIRLAQESRISHSEIKVSDVMTPRDEVEALNMLSVRNAQVGHIVATLHAVERRHLLVVQSVDFDEFESSGGDGNEPSISGSAQVIRGLFSSAQIGRQLRADIDEIMTAAHSLSEIQHGLP